jgi:hypothetical protein
MACKRLEPAAGGHETFTASWSSPEGKKRMELRIVNPLEFRGWDEAILPYENHSIFHTTFWARVLAEAYGYKPVYFTALEGERPKAVIPVMEVRSFITGTRGVSLPFTDSCEPVAEDGRKLKDLHEAVIRHGKRSGWKSLEWRGGETLFPSERISCCFYEHTIDLCADGSGFESGLRSSTRRNVKKAKKEGIEVKVSRTPEAVETFYRLNCVTRRHHGLPPQPVHFFRKIHEHIISKDQGVVALAFHRSRVIAGCVYFYFGRSAVYKFGASDRSYQGLRPNNLVMWEAIRYLRSRGLEKLSLGRSEPDNQGLLQFKRGWNARESFLKYHRLDLHRNRFVQAPIKTEGALTRVFRVAPIPLLRLIGAALYRHVG